MLKVQSSWRRLEDEKRCQKEGFHGYDNRDIFPLDIDGYFYNSFSYDSTDVLLWLTHLILVQWLNSFITLFPHISYHSHDESNVLPYCHPFLLLWHLFLCCIIVFPWLRYCAYWGCASWLISDSFLTHIILHAGRIFQQWCHNHIICLVIESALHLYKGQFSPWLGQFTYYRNSSPVFIGFNSASVKVQSKRSTSRLGVSKTLRFFWSQTYVIIGYFINFQVHLSPGQIQIKFALCILGICLQVNWVLEIKKVSQTTASLTLRDIGLRAQD